MKLQIFTCFAMVITHGLCQLIKDAFFEENIITGVFHFKLRIIPRTYNITWEKLAKNGSFCQVQQTRNIRVIDSKGVAALRVLNLTDMETGMYRVTVTSWKQSDTKNLTMCNCKIAQPQQIETNENSENTMTINRSSFTTVVIFSCVIVVGSLLTIAILITRRRYQSKREDKGRNGAAASNMDGLSSTHAYADIDVFSNYENLRAARPDSHRYDREQNSTDGRISNPYLTPINTDDVDEESKSDSTDNLLQDEYAKPNKRNDVKKHYENCNGLRENSNTDDNYLTPKAACPIIRIEKSRLT